MYKLRHYQEGSTPAIVSYLAVNKKRNPIVALPTGAGKSLCIADFIQWALSKKRKVLVLSHVREILEQNAATIEKYNDIKVAVYSASIGRKEIGDVTVGGIQSVYRQIDLFSKFDYIIIDECHRVSYDENSMYRQFLSKTDAPVIGFTATYFRLGTGKIYGRDSDNLFDDVVYDWTHKEKFVQLVNEGWLSPLVTEGTGYKMNTEGVRVTGGDFNLADLADKYDREPITEEILNEICAKGVDRKQWLIFAIDIKHADSIAESLNRRGISTIVVHSEMAAYGFDRNKVLQMAKDQEYRCIVNVDILTTGFDHPAIDLIATLRPTESPVLHVQILGRGSRIYPTKSDCLVLDFAGNLARLGPINDVYVRVKGKGKGGGEPIMKQCPKCDLMVHAAARKCSRCGHEFPFEHGLTRSAGTDVVIEVGKPIWLTVDAVEYDVKADPGRPAIFQVTYICGNKRIKEMICLEHRGFAREKAVHWLKYRGIPDAAKLRAADVLLKADQLTIPSRIRVEKKNGYINVTETVLR